MGLYMRYISWRNRSPAAGRVIPAERIGLNMIWHEVVCDACYTTAPGINSRREKGVIVRVKRSAINSGWVVKRDGAALCPECRKKAATLQRCEDASAAEED